VKRTFIAIDIPPNDTVTNFIENIRSVLKNEKIKWVSFTQFHITIQFLGDTDETHISAINHHLKEITRNFEGFTLKTGNPGVFRNIRDPNVLWLDIHKNPALSELKSRIEQRLEEFGYKSDNRPFHPHLTIGRIKHLNNTQNLARIIENKRDRIFQEIKIDHLVFYESILKQEGPEYVALGKHYLK
jgi:2'-5' RNA ligase